MAKTEVAEVSEMRLGYETIYPGSHELRPLAIFQVKSPLVPEGTLVMGALEKAPLNQSMKNESYNPAQYAALLSELAALIVHQLEQSKAVRSSIGYHDELHL